MAEKQGGRGGLAGVKVMVVDDSTTIRKTAAIFLEGEGCQIILAEDGMDALQKVAEHNPDIIFIDVMMPRLDGYQTCTLIKSNKDFRSIPVVMLSSKDGLFDKVKGSLAGSDEYLAKPFKRDDLVAVMHKNLRRQTMAA